jgi:hypothetical protein
MLAAESARLNVLIQKSDKCNVEFWIVCVII